MSKNKLTVIVVPEQEAETRTYEISYRRLKAVIVATVVGMVLLTVMGASWWYIAAQAARVPGLERQLTELQAERGNVTKLAQTLTQVESEYRQVRHMLGGDAAGPEQAVLPPLPHDTPVALSGGDAAGAASLPVSWPLTQPGYITQRLVVGADGEHPGIDVAVPKDSYIRAAGAGTVADAGRDEVYGNYVVIDHGDGYRSLYAHASRIFVRSGEHVERDEVIGLTGSTGRSTAPHLHFEIRKDGRAIDPLTLVKRR
jgi:murein DD-endopeptidase MepM/ murein hydrolase activator NlpD